MSWVRDFERELDATEGQTPRHDYDPNVVTTFNARTGSHAYAVVAMPDGTRRAVWAVYDGPAFSGYMTAEAGGVPRATTREDYDAYRRVAFPHIHDRDAVLAQRPDGRPVTRREALDWRDARWQTGIALRRAQRHAEAAVLHAACSASDEQVAAWVAVGVRPDAPVSVQG